MFDLSTGRTTHIPHTPAVPLLASMAAQVTTVGLAIVVPLLYVTDALTAPQSMMAFVAAAPPPPPPPPPRITRVGGDIKAPARLKRVEPVYPPLAVAANLEGTVSLDAIVDEEGGVTDVKVLRSAGVLDRAAVDAVPQWRYAPLLLNGRPAPFQLAVVLSFRLQR